MEMRRSVLIVESSAAIGKRLMKLLTEDNRAADILYASTAEEAFALILSQQTDVIVWGIEWNSKNTSTLTEIRKKTKPSSLILFSDFADSANFRSMDIYIHPYAFIDKHRDFEDLRQLILAPPDSKHPSSLLNSHSETYCDLFLNDPLF
jgi:chemotaxis response regulator CheB